MKKKILVVDDELQGVEKLTTRLEAHGYKVVAAFDGKEALEKVAKEKPDLIILDILMPKMDGYTFVKEMKKLREKPPVIVVSARSEMADLFELEGVTNYLVKPFDSEELIKKIEENLK